MIVDLFQYQGLVEPVYVEVAVEVIVPAVIGDDQHRSEAVTAESFFFVESPVAAEVVPDLSLAICDMPVPLAEWRDRGGFSLDLIAANPPVPAPDFIQGIGVDFFPGYHSMDYIIAGAVMPPVEQTFPTSFDDLLDILRGLAAELQPNAQNEWEKRRNWQKLVEAFGRI